MSQVQIPTFKLNNGKEIPALGYGTWIGLDEKFEFYYDDIPKMVEALSYAIDIGYRHIDTAHLYRVEPEIGQVINKKIQDGVVKREDLFVTTKVWLQFHREADVEVSVRASLRRSNLEYFDMVLLHWPMSITVDGVDEKIDYLESWRGLEKVLEKGLTKSIGVSNFNLEQMRRLVDNCKVLPACHQIEINLNLGQKELVDFCQSQKIVVVAYSPFGTMVPSRAAPNSPEPKLDNPTMLAIGKKYGKTVTQIALKYLLCTEKDGGKAFRIPLNDGNAIPALGLGTFLGFDENGQKAVLEHEVDYPVTWALEAGYRLIDTAAAYRNEDQVGLGVRASSVPRENVFIVTKLPSNEQREVVPSLRRSLDRLNMTYVDLYLIHTPVTHTPDSSGFDVIDYLDTWKGMEEAKKLGLAKSIGISNFNISQIERLLGNCEIKPTVLQVEVNLNLAQEDLIKYCKAHDIVVMAYTPFGSLFDRNAKPIATRADDPILVEMANKYKKTVAQISLRYLVQKGVAPIPKSSNKNRVEENIEVFDFELTAQDMDTLSKFNKNYRVVLPSFWQDHPYYPFEKVDVPAKDLFSG